VSTRARNIKNDALRFLLAGSLNTALTSVAYFLCAIFLKPTTAYVIAWVIGIVFVAIVYPDRVFLGGRNDLASRLLLVALTTTAFFSGLVALDFLVRLTGDHRIAFLMTLFITVVINFFGGRFISRQKN